ncbi:hypothetical protein PIB30_108343, partial [Stylosanthes scabra]|nr:hypothetical protein [Stylosanthes scabra]
MKKKAYISWENEESDSSDEDENANICLMAKENEVRNGAKNLKFYVDSGCSKHMTGEATNFINKEPINGGNVVFGEGKIVGVGSI